jgi:hypothetical protein
MNRLTLIISTLLICGSIFAQNITNTLPYNGNFIIKDATNTFFTLAQTCGNVGIGTTTFDGTNPEKLKVDAGNTSSKNVISGYGTINSYLQLNIQNLSNGSSASADIVATNDIGNDSKGYLDMGINSSNYSDAAYSIGGKNDAYIYCVGNTGGSTVGGNLSIGTASTNAIIKFHIGGTTSDKERMRIDANGNVGIGTQNPGTYKLYISGNCYATQFYVPSDIRLKNDIQPLDNTLEKIMKLRGVTFKYNNDVSGKKQIGFIAQELEEIFPELVTTGEDGFKGVSYSNVTAVLLEGIKQQQKQIEDLNSRLTALEKKAPVTQSAGFIQQNSNLGVWFFLSALTLSIAGIVIRKNTNSKSK